MLLDEKDIIKNIKKGKIFIYPTDTIYGIGCDATNSKAVKKIREIKKKDNKPFSVIAPSKKWIIKNFYVNKKYLKKLPGKYTLILKLKNKKVVSKYVNNNMSTLGVRIPKHDITKIIQKSGKPFVSTSVNITGKDYIKNLKDLPKEILKNVDVIINVGVLNNEPSTIINLIGKKLKIIKR
jgi:L-threonylcarbamoyladenylate synthase